MEAPSSNVEFNNILLQQDITPFFQPIFNLTSGHIYGHEALARGPESSRFFNSKALFEKAIELGKLYELESICFSKSNLAFLKLELPGLLFLNTDFSLINDKIYREAASAPCPNKKSVIKSHQVSKHRVLELLKDNSDANEISTLESILAFKKLGYQIAINNLGAGHSDFKLWMEIQPDIVKIDRYFIQNIHRSRVKQEFVRSIVSICSRLNCNVIAEGIETLEELNKVLELGVTIGQGYLLGKPTPSAKCFLNKALQSNSQKNQKKLNIQETILSLITPVPTSTHDCLLIDIAELFKAEPNLVTLPILKNQAPIGVIKRHQLHELFSTPYGRALHENKHATHVLNKDALIVESNTSLADVSQKIIYQDSNDILVVKNNAFIGMANIKDLLKQITELKIQHATYSNPLTLLPGNVLITQEVSKQLTSQQNFQMAYFDLNDFKPFNDYFGYATGDEAIKLVSHLIKRHVQGNDDFIGHIGGDDFVVVFRRPDWKEKCLAILTDFSFSVRAFYDKESQLKGGIWSKNRKDETAFYSFLSLSVGVINPLDQGCSDHLEVAELAAVAKKEAKKTGLNALFIAQSNETTPIRPAI